MPTEMTWPDGVLRLALAVAAGLIIGYDRSEQGRAAGLRTTLLVCLAAAVSMIQVNLLLPIAGKAPNSFVVMDLMRLPLGILTGMGFIGAGAILRRGDQVRGVTTAATLWMVTVIGMCFGGGQFGLGLAGLGLCFAALRLLKYLEKALTVDRRATLTVVCRADGPGENDIREELRADGLHIESWEVIYRHTSTGAGRTIRGAIIVRGTQTQTRPPDVVDRLSRRPGVTKLGWKL